MFSANLTSPLKIDFNKTEKPTTKKRIKARRSATTKAYRKPRSAAGETYRTQQNSAEIRPMQRRPRTTHCIEIENAKLDSDEEQIEPIQDGANAATENCIKTDTSRFLQVRKTPAGEMYRMQHNYEETRPMQVRPRTTHCIEIEHAKLDSDEEQLELIQDGANAATEKFH